MILVAAQPDVTARARGPATARRRGWCRERRCATTFAAAVGMALCTVGCVSTTEIGLRNEIIGLREQLRQKDNELVAQRASLEEVARQLAVARSISEDDLKRVFYPERLVIDKLSGGADYDGKPGDDGVTVYLKPVDPAGDVIKVAGDIRIQLYDLAAPPGKNLIGEYVVPVDQVGKLWQGKLWTNHYTIRCPWPAAPPERTEITIRATFVDYLTKRVVSAQSTCQVKLPPR